MYLDFAEIQALHRSPMYMKDWISKLDDFLKVATPREILSHAGKVIHKVALDKAQSEYQKYQEQLKNDQLSLVEKHFFQLTNEVEQMKS